MTMREELLDSLFTRVGRWWDRLHERVCGPPKLDEKEIVERFHRLFYDSRLYAKTFLLGIHAGKCPLDFWIFQEMISEIKPDLIIECGTFHGGSALFLAAMCDLVNHGRIISIDIEENLARPRHKRIEYLLGSSTTETTIEQVKKRIHAGDKIMVDLDSDHHKEHVLKELRIYSKFVTKGSYIIVEDTNINGHPVLPDFGPGPMEAVEEFLKENKDFVIDKTREKLLLTFNPDGYLKKIND